MKTGTTKYNTTQYHPYPYKELIRMTPLDDLDKEATRRQTEFDTEREAQQAQVKADAAANPPTPPAKPDGTSKPDGTPTDIHGIPADVIEAAKRAALKVTIDQLIDEGLDRQDNSPIAVTFTRKQSQAIRACQELISMSNAKAKDRSHQEFVSDCVVSVLKSTIARVVKEMLSDAEIHIIDLDATDDTHEKSDGK